MFVVGFIILLELSGGEHYSSFLRSVCKEIDTECTHTNTARMYPCMQSCGTSKRLNAAFICDL